MPGPPDQSRDGHGRYLRTPGSVERDAEAAGLRADGYTYQQIADRLGFCHKAAAWRAVERARVAIVREPAERLRAVEAAKLDELHVAALEILERVHPMVSHGKLVTGPGGEPLEDDRPRLAAIRELRAVRESYRKLWGLDAPQSSDVTLRQSSVPATEEERREQLDAVSSEIMRRAADGQGPDAERLLAAPDDDV